MADPYRPRAGVSAEVEVTPTEFLKNSHIIDKSIVVDDAARDSGNTTTTTLRPGLMLGKITASSKHAEYNATASDGTETCVGILKDQVKVIDSDAVAVDADAVMVIHGHVDESALHGCDAAAKVDLLGQIIFD